ncbi:oligosaccharide flippase family protein [Enterococcus hulanensis]|uniref:oligosaccharide flippase family protein n=1 Tax=Enterococcus hulanensis TaxID=2559929 RepID=UPI001A912DE5|nr:oligosaccharide flippase family protein [Enterococcus hulanensis]MBO0411985.1 oligosaccharide flippase family protein [Enterococcus hulanensis]
MKKTVTNIFYNATYQIFIILIPIITVPYVSRILGAKQLGINSFLVSIDTFLGVIILMGLSQLGVRVISRSQLKEDIRENFFRLWKLQLLTGIVVISAFCLFTIFFTKDSIYYWLQIPFLISYTLDISWFFIGIGEIKTVISRNTVVKILALIFIFLFVKNKDDLSIYMLINSVGTMLANCFFWISLRKYISINGRGKKKSLKFFSIDSKPFLPQALVLLIPQIAVQVYTSLDKTVVGWLAGSTELSYYDQSQKIARIVLSIVTSISIVLMPTMAKMDLDDRGEEKLTKILKVSYDYTLIISLFFTCYLSLISETFVPFFFGNNFNPMIPNMRFVSLIIVPIAIGGVFANQYTLAKGMYREYSIPYVIGAVTNIVLNLTLVPLFHANGGTASLIITEYFVCFLRIFLIRKHLSFAAIFKGQVKYFIAILFSLLVGRVLYITNFSSFINIVLNGVIVLFAFGLGLILLKTRVLDDFLMFRKKILGREKK